MRRSFRFCLLVGAVVVWFACSGSGASGPTTPSGPQATLTTAHGAVTVFTNGHDFDAGKTIAAIEEGYARARAQAGPRADAVTLDGMAIFVQAGVFNGAVGQYHPASDQIDIAQGVEQVLAHELQHRFCHRFGNSGACCTYQDHRPGYDLACNAQ